MIRTFFVFLFLYFSFGLTAQVKTGVGTWNIGLTYDLQKFNQFSCLRFQFNSSKNNQVALSIGFSPQKARQTVLVSSLMFDYSKRFPLKKLGLGPVVHVGMDSYVFGTRFNYTHASMGYRMSMGSPFQFFQELRFGPTLETFEYLSQAHRNLTWNYHFKLGLQYAIR